MRTFKQIYREMKHYPYFNREPSTLEQAITSTNIFFAEFMGEIGIHTDDEFDFFVKSYRHSASQFILNFKTDTRTFKQFLKGIYENLQVEEAA